MVKSVFGVLGPWSAGASLVAVLSGSATGQATTRASVATGGGEADNGSEWGRISADGRYVAFWSPATNLVTGGTNGAYHVYLHDRQGGTTELVSVDSNGVQGNAHSDRPSISRDGRCVAFQSIADNLVAGDTNGDFDVFVRDYQSGTTERVSVDSAGREGDGWSAYPSISDDGRYVAFLSRASNFDGAGTNSEDVFVHDRDGGTTERASVDSNEVPANSGSIQCAISADGRYVAFSTWADNLDGADSNGEIDVYLRDRQNGTTERVSLGSSGAEPEGECSWPTISADGRYVAFLSAASNLVDGDTNAAPDVFVRDRQSQTIERVSVASSGAQANGASGPPAISAGGRYVAFRSLASNLVAGDTNGIQDVFVRDRQSGITELVSVDSTGTQGNDYSYGGTISADGNSVAFMSLATNLVAADANGSRDIFVRDRGNGLGTKYCTANASSTGAPADLSASGSASSGAGDLGLMSMPVPNQNGIFFHGANQSQVPFGNGFLCTAGGIARGAVVVAAGNLVTYLYDNSDAKHSVAAFAGSTRNFQYWFRDPMGGGALFNTSNALSLGILP